MNVCFFLHVALHFVVLESLLFQCSGVGETTCSSTFGGIVTSGGGFSNYYSRTLAPWQEAAVSGYLAGAAAKMPPSGYFNAQGRAYPDVATYGSNYFVFLGGSVVRESGTSASAPVFAAMVTLWNDMRLAYDLPALGFLNPFLYQAATTTPEAFQARVIYSFFSHRMLLLSYILNDSSFP
jgi:hypothetical protein